MESEKENGNIYYENGTLEAIVNYKNGERNFYSRRFLISFSFPFS